MAITQAQPDAMPILKLRLDEVVPVETPGSLSPSTVVSGGGAFWLRTEIGAEGMLWPIFNLMTWDVEHLAEDIVAGGPAVALAPLVGLVGAFPAPPGIWSITAGPYVLPASTYRIFTKIRLNAAMPPLLRAQIGGGADGILLEVIP
jgi:hypothetical protein